MGRVIEFPGGAAVDDTGCATADALVERLGIEGAMRVAAAITVRAAMHRPDGKPTPVKLASVLIDLYACLRDASHTMGAYDRDPKAVRRAFARARNKG